MGKVSICIPQFNRFDALRLVIEDLLNQTYQDFELLIVDDSLSCDSLGVVSEFSDPRICYFKNENNLGLYPNFNRCLKLAQGEYVAIYHNHDRYASDIVKRSVELLDQNPQIGFVHAGTISWAEDGRDRSFVQDWPEVANGKLFAKHLIRYWDSPVHQPTVMARRSIYDQVGNYDFESYAACADSAIWIKMSLLADVGYIAMPLMRVTPRQRDDFYGKFNWQDILGMANVHRLGLELLRESWGEFRFNREKLKMQNRHDRHFLLLLLQWLARGETQLIEQGLEAVEQACSSQAVWVSKKLVTFGMHSRPLLAVLSRIYGLSMRWRGKLASAHGQRISERYQNQVH